MKRMYEEFKPIDYIPETFIGIVILITIVLVLVLWVPSCGPSPPSTGTVELEVVE